MAVQIDGPIARARAEIVFEMCVQANEYDFGRLHSRDDLAELLPGMSAGHLDTALRELVELGKVIKSDSNDVAQYSIKPEVCYKLHRPELYFG